MDSPQVNKYLCFLLVGCPFTQASIYPLVVGSFQEHNHVHPLLVSSSQLYKHVLPPALNF